MEKSCVPSHTFCIEVVSGTVESHFLEIKYRYNGSLSLKSTLKCLEIVVAVEPNYGKQPYYLLHPNEYSFVTDILSCSYHPPECACNNTIINLSGTVSCFQNHNIDYDQLIITKSNGDAPVSSSLAINLQRLAN